MQIITELFHNWNSQLEHVVFILSLMQRLDLVAL